MLIFKREVLPHRAAKAQQARKIHTSSALEYNVLVLFRIDYIANLSENEYSEAGIKFYYPSLISL